MELKEFLKSAAHVKPAEKQLRMLRETPFYAFVHFSPNTFTNLEWGLGNENPAIFNPTELDCDGWARAIKAAGMKGMVLTAKHHDGFCLWQTKYTEHSMKNSPYKNGKGDIVAEAAEACKKYGLKFGFYLSPWDRNSKYYGTDEYNTYYKNQLTELLTGYGEIFYVWFDGACGEGPNGKKQEYDFPAYIELIKKYQPNAAYFHDAGCIRWCGNESGASPFQQWAVVPSEMCGYGNAPQTSGAAMDGNLNGIYNTDIDIGSISNIMYSKGLVFSPAETDMSIRSGWFYHANEEPHSLDRLFDTYIRTVGGNTTFNLNIPPMPNGKFDERDVTRLKELGDKIKTEFGKDLASDATIFEEAVSDTQTSFIIKLPEVREIKYIELAERISEGQRVEGFKVFVKNEDGIFDCRKCATTIGSRKILQIGEYDTDEIKVTVTAARDKVDMEWIKLY